MMLTPQWWAHWGDTHTATMVRQAAKPGVLACLARGGMSLKKHVEKSARQAQSEEVAMAAAAPTGAHANEEPTYGAMAWIKSARGSFYFRVARRFESCAPSSDLGMRVRR